jgi:hypothetical protein
MTKTEQYRQRLASLENWDDFLLKESGLPGPRGNLELAQVVADTGSVELFERYLSLDAERAPTNSPLEFLAFCGVVGLGRLLVEGQRERFTTLRRFASDRRWRVREGVAMALQRLGDHDMDSLLQEMEKWRTGTSLEQRAAAAALCEPRLLKQDVHARAVLRILDRITASLRRAQDRKAEDFLVLRKGLAYCWSVAAAALPEEGKKAMEKWLVETDKDIRWIMKENLKKDRLLRMDAEWARNWKSRLDV